MTTPVYPRGSPSIVRGGSSASTTRRCQWNASSETRDEGTGSSMRILWVKMGGLWPATTGGRVRSLRTVSELAKRHTVTVVTTHGLGDDPEGLKAHLSQCEKVVSIPF